MTTREREQAIRLREHGWYVLVSLFILVAGGLMVMVLTVVQGILPPGREQHD